MLRHVAVARMHTCQDAAFSVYRNIFSHVPSPKVREIAAMLKAIHASDDRRTAVDNACQVIKWLCGMRLARAADLVEASVHETLAY